jgi:hypothetical protein
MIGWTGGDLNPWPRPCEGRIHGIFCSTAELPAQPSFARTKPGLKSFCGGSICRIAGRRKINPFAFPHGPVIMPRATAPTSWSREM